VHHRATTPISTNIKDQIRIAKAALEPEIRRCQQKGGRYFHVRGTEAHVGPSAIYEDDVAEQLGAVPDGSQFARYELWKRVGDPDGPLVHLLHHIGTTGSAAHESSAVNAELAAEYVEAAKAGLEAPRYIVRSHRHRFVGVDIPTAKGHAASLVTPGWQL